MVTDALGHYGLARAQRESEFFFADEMMTVPHWTFDQADANRITSPVLLGYGEHSPAMTRRLVERLAQMLPDADTAALAEANHAAPLTHPSSLATMINRHAQRRL
ncbi:MAG: hypothetical protein QOE59_3518 [Actinomycetota bacterium]|nr:hypothetical protein [Actinomycetota bacterium]